MPVAFALSGGGARAAAQVGLLRALVDQRIHPDMVVGASSGAVNGAWYALHPDRLDDLEEVWLGLTTRGIFPGTLPRFAYNFARHGYMHGIDSWGRILARYFGSTRIEDAAIPLGVVAVRLLDGAAASLESGPTVPALMASTSVPGVFPPQSVAGELYVDGAVVEFLPIPTATKRGATTIYALDCSDYPPGDGRLGLAMDRAGQIGSTAWVRMAVEQARERDVEVHLLRPPLGELYDGRDFRQTKRLITAGFEYAVDRLATAVTASGADENLRVG